MAAVGYAGDARIRAVRVAFDSSKLGYDALLRAFWSNVDPTNAGGQFAEKVG